MNNTLASNIAPFHIATNFHVYGSLEQKSTSNKY